jgi:hypothetical protein
LNLMKNNHTTGCATQMWTTPQNPERSEGRGFEHGYGLLSPIAPLPAVGVLWRVLATLRCPQFCPRGNPPARGLWYNRFKAAHLGGNRKSIISIQPIHILLGHRWILTSCIRFWKS